MNPQLKFVLKKTASGWGVELCKQDKGDFYRTASVRWRSTAQLLQPELVYSDYNEASAACNKKNGLSK
jgi:hypothetical protein